MKIAIVAPSPVPFAIGGAEKLWWGLQRAINAETHHETELIKVPVRERDLFDLVDGYRRFHELDLAHFDRVISTKYPAWAVRHPNHHVYLQHKLRGLYDTYPVHDLPLAAAPRHPALREICDYLERHRPAPARLAELFDRVEAAREGGADRDPEAAIPSPFARALVHYIDACALAPAAIRRYAAISANVAQRRDYFPAGVKVDVIHHPSDLAALSAEEADAAQGYGLAVGRLDTAKRFGLLIDAMRRARTTGELHIAGTGPEQERLQQRAAGDPRIKFLGRLTDSELRAAYAGASWVGYVPYDEDLGLVTLEALQAGKPLLTCTDSGGVLEFVRDGEAGLVRAPDAAALAGAIDALADDPAYARRLGAAGPERVGHVTWPATVSALLQDAAAPRTVAVPGERGQQARAHVVVLSTFPVIPPAGGGQSRIFHLYEALARTGDARITLLTLGTGDDPPDSVISQNGLRERRIAPTAEQGEDEARLRGRIGISSADIAAIDGWRKNTRFVRALAEELADADVAVASHPYLVKAIAAHYNGPLWYEAHNVEADLKAAVLPETDDGRAVLADVERVESLCCQSAELVFACTEGDLDRLHARFGITGKRAVVPNAVDPDRVTYIPPGDRRERKRALGFDDHLVALFMGSSHPPNVEALYHVIALAAARPEVAVLVVGSVCQDLPRTGLPANLRPLGLVSDAEKKVVLQASDVGLNPMASGSGSNLKMLDYMAAGLVVLTTPFGMRGLDLTDGHDALVRPADGFAAALDELASMGPDARTGLTDAARARVESRFAWSRAAAVLAGHLTAGAERGRAHHAA